MALEQKRLQKPPELSLQLTGTYRNLRIRGRSGGEGKGEEMEPHYKVEGKGVEGGEGKEKGGSGGGQVEFGRGWADLKNTD